MHILECILMFIALLLIGGMVVGIAALAAMASMTPQEMLWHQQRQRKKQRK